MMDYEQEEKDYEEYEEEYEEGHEEALTPWGTTPAVLALTPILDGSLRGIADVLTVAASLLALLQPDALCVGGRGRKGRG